MRSSMKKSRKEEEKKIPEDISHLKIEIKW